MGTVTVDGYDVLTATIIEDRTGVWLASLEADYHEALTGQLTIDFGNDVTFVGTVLHGGVESGRLKLRMVGGAAGMKSPLDAKYYKGSPFSVIVAHILSGAGETLSSDSEDLSEQFQPSWTRMQGPASRALDQVVETLGRVWRIQRDGTVWIGTDTYPELETEHTELDADPRRTSMIIAPALTPEVRPGVTFEGQQVTRVTTSLKPTGIRQHVFFEDDRLHEVLRKLIGAFAQRGLDYRAIYGCTVGEQSGQTVGINPDDEVVGHGLGGLTEVALRYGLPGFTATIPDGTRVGLGFLGGDPSKPYAASWEPGAVTEVVFDGGAEKVARTNDTIQGGYLLFDALTPLLYYAPDVSGFPGVYTAVLPTAGLPAPGTPGTPIVGDITSGNAKLKA